jgi:hypothetical protein
MMNLNVIAVHFALLRATGETKILTYFGNDDDDLRKFG